MLNAYQRHLLQTCEYSIDTISSTLWYHLALGYHTAFETVAEIVGEDAELDDTTLRIVAAVLLSMHKAEQKQNDTSN
jgi:hypothetical protein